MDMILTMTDVHPCDRLAYWYDVACKCFVDHECEIANPSAVSVTLHNAQLGEIGFSTIESSGLQSVRRTPLNIANSEDDVFFSPIHRTSTAASRPRTAARRATTASVSGPDLVAAGCRVITSQCRLVA
ncbi:MAG: hypothetical protein ACXWJV_09400, partial [Hyphomicrobium sp.]